MTQCIKTDCVKDQKSRGFCSNHYKKLLAHIEEKVKGLPPHDASVVFKDFWKDLETRGKALAVKMTKDPHDTDSLLDFIK